MGELMAFLLPVIIVLTVKHSDSWMHSLRYFGLGISDPGHGVPEFISVGYVDSHPITTYDSVTRQKEPRAPWMAENLAPDHWERGTQLLRGLQQTFKVELKRLQRHYNHSGSHTYQGMTGCELLEDGSTTGFLQYAYDGQDFLIFSKDTLSWLAVDNVAHTIKRAWEADQHELQHQKNWLEEECIAWLKRFLEYGKDTLQRTEPPLVRVNRKETFPGVTTLFCKAHGFYPPEIYMTWMKNGEEIVQEMDYGDILPSGDGTYQMWASVELDPQSSNLYSCHVEHCGVHMVLQVPQETLQARREWGPIFNILKEKNFQPRISYPAKLSFTMEYYAAIKNDELMSFVGTWMKLDIIILSKLSQGQKTKHCMFSLIGGN
ncbi:major histocompatibility complex class I-related gene protein isoform X2 [Symphalangus syndactylus]|uniref:major histocompatibility complex class I-related gene protein isoform X2 n=1 Tax=Symphalangus syndactylus TaxID=9590 RepID=UPI002441660F|nr:major histocompatibility complex class I-related gene protein isoform X1 [Symphalangus syndactylus]